MAHLTGARPGLYDQRVVKPLATALLVIGLALGLGLGCSRDAGESGSVANVRLGMAPRDVRERFQGGSGSWQTALGAGDDTVLEWTSKDTKSSVAQARFEFHLGMLVAIRARMTEPSSTDEVALSPKTVTLRSPAKEGGTNVTVLARDCPTHKDEAESIARRRVH